ncbi:MAG: FecR family protein [Bacteroidota bacterium]
MKDEKLIQYIQQQIDDDSRRIVEDWISASAENEAYYHELRDAWLSALYADDSSVFNPDQAWERFLEREALAVRHRKWKYFARVFVSSAAAVILLLIGVFSFFQLQQSADLKTHNYSQSEVLELPDGSEVTLNKAASLQYPEEFLASTREITIFGEAFFNVAPDREKPFIVKAGDYRIKVLGTRFNVREIRSDIFEVYVTEGKVAVYSAGNEESAKELLPGDLIVLKPEASFDYKSAGRNYLSWKTNELVFKNTSLDNVIHQLEGHYDQAIRVDRQMTDQRLTARFKDKSLDEVLEIMQMIFDFEINQQQDTIFLSVNSPPENEKAIN